MKITTKSLIFLFSGIILVFLLSGCKSSSTSTNQHLGKLPGIAKKYKDEIGNKKKELQACTDLEKAFKLDKEAKILAKEGNQLCIHYVVSSEQQNRICQKYIFTSHRKSRY